MMMVEEREEGGEDVEEEERKRTHELDKTKRSVVPDMKRQGWEPKEKSDETTKEKGEEKLWTNKKDGGQKV